MATAWWRSARAGTVAAFVAAYALPIFLARTHAIHNLGMLVWRLDTDHVGLDRLFEMVSGVVGPSYGAALMVATVGVALGYLARTIARARVRAGERDPLERFRAFVAARPRRTSVLVALPALLWSALITWWHLRTFDDVRPSAHLPGLLIPAALVLLVHVALLQRGLRALLAPTLDASEIGGEEARADGFTFDAVAVTRETRAAVAGVAALSAAMTAAVFVVPMPRMHDPSFVAGLAAYVALTAAAAALFRRASRISIGLDGIFVRGSSRARFYAYRDIDGAAARGSDLVLLRGERVVLRLQLHGKDASRRDALLGRLQAAISRAAAERDAPATSFVSGASTADITRAAEGGGDYRQQAVSREQLWAVLEGPAIDSVSRRAAAEALARSQDPAERARLRVAAEQCAEPSVRLRMHELIEADADAHEIDDGADANGDAGGRALRHLRAP